MGLHVNTKAIIKRTQPHPYSSEGVVNRVRGAGRVGADDFAEFASGVQSSLNQVHTALRQNAPAVQDPIIVTDSGGNVLAALGTYSTPSGALFPGVFAMQLAAGDQYLTGDPVNAILSVNPTTGQVTIGNAGYVNVLDPYGSSAAWIGNQFDTLTVTGAVDNGSGLIRLTVTAHTLATGDVAHVMNVGGVPNATGIFTVTKVNANTLDLQASVFVGTYTSGGTVDRLLHVTGAVDNGSGLIRLTVTAHGYESGDKVNVASAGGVPNATGQWTITVFDANHFDLNSSTFAGLYTSGGICLRYFAGMLAQTFAIGPSFANYKLRGFADGSLQIKDAKITLNGSVAVITLDPNIGEISVAGVAHSILTKITAEPDPLGNIGGVLITANPYVVGGAYTTVGLAFIALFPGPSTGSYCFFEPTEWWMSSEDAGVCVDVVAGTALDLGGHIWLRGYLDAAAYKVNGVAGIDLSKAVGVSITSTPVTIQYKDWAGTNQSATLLSGVALNTENRTWRKGILTV